MGIKDGFYLNNENNREYFTQTFKQKNDDYMTVP